MNIPLCPARKVDERQHDPERRYNGADQEHDVHPVHE
jgi:hypothetical protein